MYSFIKVALAKITNLKTNKTNEKKIILLILIGNDAY